MLSDLTESSERRYYNGSGKTINLRVESMRNAHEAPVLIMEFDKFSILHSILCSAVS
ncbi:hypothetical protein T07_13028 [Trichinella nelsoni]|uniref:Uncharacterized protein n=1 Tax=Trichinella nelsoni TaxID=6336 RepID=A0A0V0RB82_9BILA|nr:hypothetical protein T07_13028 [Trichinella nelsoni]